MAGAEATTSRRDQWESRSTFEDAYRVLATNLIPALERLPKRSVMVSSATRGEGRTVTTLKLGITLAERGLRVVLVDLDLRNPQLHLLAGVSREPGFVDVIDGRQKLRDCLVRIDGEATGGPLERGLFLVPAGRQIDRPDELLGRSLCAQVIERLTSSGNVVLIDAPPATPLADALSIAQFAAGAVLVLDPRRTSGGDVERSRDVLRRNGTELLGLAVNRVRWADAAALEREAVVGHRTGGPVRR